MKSQMMNLAGLLIAALSFAPPALAQTVPGYTVETYASVNGPVKLSFAPNGDLYVGRDLSGSGGLNSDPTPIHRVLAGGSVIQEFGPSHDDPDAVLFDATGLIAPSANSVLVGSQLNSTEGAIYAISPGGSSTTVFGPTTAFLNPTDMIFDGTSRLVFTDHNNQHVKVSTGGTPTTLFSLSSRTIGIAYDPNTDRLYTSGLDNTIRAHQPDGTLIDATFATGRAIAVAAGAGFGTDLYAIDHATGELLRIDSSGTSSVVGTGFGFVHDLEFGPDGALYVSEFDNDRIVKVEPLVITATWADVFAIQAHDAVLHPELAIGLQPISGAAVATAPDAETVVLTYSGLSLNENIQLDVATWGPPFYPPDPIKVFGNDRIEIELDENGTMFTIVIELASTTGEVLDPASVVGFNPQPEPPTGDVFAFNPQPEPPKLGEGMSIVGTLVGGVSPLTEGSTEISLTIQVLDDLDVPLPLNLVDRVEPVPALTGLGFAALLAGLLGAGVLAAHRRSP